MKVMHASTHVAPLGKAAPAPTHRASYEMAPSPGVQVPVHLSPRQLEVLTLLCEGLPNKLICRKLNIAAGTVKVHISVILRELGVSSRLQAVVAAQRWGLFGKVAGSTPPQPTGSAPACDSPIVANPSDYTESRRLAAA